MQAGYEQAFTVLAQLEFLRPQWFYAFLPLCAGLWLLYRRRRHDHGWQSVIDPELLPVLLQTTALRRSPWPPLLALIAGSLCILAAAGPVYKQLPLPVFREDSAVVIALDLSRSMDATDVRPSRLARARLKLLDLLTQRGAGQTALLVYAADAFVVTPLTDDTKTIANLMPALDTGMMPAQGSRADIALSKAGELLQQAGIRRGHVLLVSDGAEARDAAAAADLSSLGHRVSVLAIGTQEGSPIPVEGGFLEDAGGAIVFARLQPESLQSLAAQGQGLYTQMQIDDADLELLLPFFHRRAVETPVLDDPRQPLPMQVDQWRQEGPWLLLLVIPLAALWLRRGWMVYLPLLVLPLPEPALAQDSSLWLRPDQQGRRLLERGDAEAAADTFDDPRWKATAHYRSGNYEAALQLLDNPTRGDDYYNRGNALAQLGRYDEALEAYARALELDAANADARHNRDLVQSLKQAAEQASAQAGDDAQQQASSEDESQQPSPGQSADAASQEQPGAAAGEETRDSNGNSNNQAASPSATQKTPPGADDAQDNETASADESAETTEPPAAGDDIDRNARAQAGSDANDDTASKNQLEPGSEASTEEAREAMQQAAEASVAEDAEQRDEQAQQQAAGIDSEADLQVLSDSSEFDPVTEQWLRRIPDDPGLLLKRKFYYQYQNMPSPNTEAQAW